LRGPLAEHSSDGAAQPAAPGRRGSAIRATRPSEGEAGHNVLPEGNTEDTLRSQTVSTKLWIYDNLDHGLLQDIIRLRVNDGVMLRLVGKWLNTGVLDGEELFLIRFADDFVIGCETESDARRLMAVLPKRFERFKLAIHPVKTRLVEFGKPGLPGSSSRGKDTFDFLGFTHCWDRSRSGHWVINLKTAKKRLRRTMKRIWEWFQILRNHSNIRSSVAQDHPQCLRVTRRVAKL